MKNYLFENRLVDLMCKIITCIDPREKKIITLKITENIAFEVKITVGKNLNSSGNDRQSP